MLSKCRSPSFPRTCNKRTDAQNPRCKAKASARTKKHACQNIKTNRPFFPSLVGKFVDTLGEITGPHSQPHGDSERETSKDGGGVVKQEGRPKSPKSFPTFCRTQPLGLRAPRSRLFHEAISRIKVRRKKTVKFVWVTLVSILPWVTLRCVVGAFQSQFA